MQKQPSPFSACMIGVHDNTHKNDSVKQAYKEEAKQVASYLTGVHHARKLPAMQLNYSDTINKLSKLQATKPVEVAPVTPAEPPRHSKDHAYQVVKQEAYMNKLKTDLYQEVKINDRKRNYNFAVGQTASIKGVFEGTAPMPKQDLFPQKATHLQILAMTGALKMPDANILPPEVARRKRWLNDEIGWEK